MERNPVGETWEGNPVGETGEGNSVGETGEGNPVVGQGKGTQWRRGWDTGTNGVRQWKRTEW